MNDLEIIPETVAEALAKWDAGETVFSVEMGGLGPGYEMAIQGLAFELMRLLQSVEDWDAMDKATWDHLADKVVHEFDKKPWGRFSGAQVGAAKNLATQVCRKGYRAALSEVVDRHIQVCKKDLRGAPNG